MNLLFFPDNPANNTITFLSGEMGALSTTVVDKNAILRSIKKLEECSMMQDSINIAHFTPVLVT